MKPSINIANTNIKSVFSTKILNKIFEKDALIYIDLKDFEYPGKSTPTGVSESWKFIYRDKQSNFFSNDNLAFEFTVKDNISELIFFNHEYESLFQDEQLSHTLKKAPFSVIMVDEQGHYINYIRKN